MHSIDPPSFSLHMSCGYVNGVLSCVLIALLWFDKTFHKMNTGRFQNVVL